MAHIYRLIVLLLALSASSAFALGKVSTSGWRSSGTTVYSDPIEACKAAGFPATSWISWNTPTYGNCGFDAWNGRQIYGQTVNAATTLSCPSNSTEAGNSCTCDAGYKENPESTACVVDEPPDPCQGLDNFCKENQNNSYGWKRSGTNLGVSFLCKRAETYYFGMGADGFTGFVDEFPGCTRGCMGSAGSYPSSFKDDEGNSYTTGEGKYTGSSCDPSVIDELNGEDPDPEKPPVLDATPDPSCPNGFKGTVNGVSVCVPPKSSSGIKEQEEKDNGDGTKTKSETSVKCENGKCEITKTSTTTNTTTNSTVSSSSVTTTVDKKAYCAENKTAGTCKDEKGENPDGDGKFGGSCKAGFECKGDAVMCAMAKEQHKRSCETLEPAKDGLWKQIEDGTDSQSAQNQQSEAKTINISAQLNTSGYGMSRSCPSDPVIDLPFVGKTFTIPFSLACPTLKILSDVALAITALSLLVWLVAGRSRDES